MGETLSEPYYLSYLLGGISPQKVVNWKCKNENRANSSKRSNLKSCRGKSTKKRNKERLVKVKNRTISAKFANSVGQTFLNFLAIGYVLFY